MLHNELTDRIAESLGLLKVHRIVPLRFWTFTEDGEDTINIFTDVQICADLLCLPSMKLKIAEKALHKYARVCILVKDDEVDVELGSCCDYFDPKEVLLKNICKTCK